MYRKNFIVKDVKGVSKEIRKKCSQVVDGLQLDLRVQSTNRQQTLQKMEGQLKKMAHKINQFSNFLLEDDFSFGSQEQHPLILTRYCDAMFTLLIRLLTQNTKHQESLESQRNYNQNNIYEVVAATKLQNFDLKEKIKSLQSQLILSRQRADCAQQISQNIRSKTQELQKGYQKNFSVVCDLLKKAQGTEIDLLQTNRFLKQQLQSLSIQFQQYKESFKIGLTSKEKEFRMKNQLEKEYQKKLNNAIKQAQSSIRSQMEKSIVEKFHLKNIKNLKF